MKIYYKKATGEIIVAVYDSDLFKTDTPTGALFDFLNIDEFAPDNKLLCKDLARSVSRADINGNSKYYVNAQGQLMERDGWAEYMTEEVI